MKTLIYFGQLSHQTDHSVQNRCFPLAAGFIGSYLTENLQGQIEVEIFKKASDLNEAFLKQTPDVLMLSNYMWNQNLACFFAAKVRKHFPDVFIIMGGPNFSIETSRNLEFLEKNPAIDVLVLQEGEIPTLLLMREHIHSGKDRFKTRCLAIPSTLSLFRDRSPHLEKHREPQKSDHGHKPLTETRLGVTGTGTSLDDIPSPYLTGMMDKFFSDGEVPLIETNRGCPFSCTFCQQGTFYFKKIRHFSTQRIGEEVGYIAQKINALDVRIHSLEIADPNFAMYERDSEILQALKTIQERYSYPLDVGCSTGKNRTQLIIDNASILKTGSIQLRSAMQSLNADTLKAIKRENIRLDTYYEIQKELDKKDLENNADLMLGLPLETFESHKTGIFRLIDFGIKEFACLQTIVLKGTEMEANDYRKRYGIKTKKRIIPECLGEYLILGETVFIFESEDIIIETSTLSFEDYKKCRALHFLVMIFHNTRLLKPTYVLLDFLNIPKSSFLNTCMALSPNPLEDLINDFVTETGLELFESDQLPFEKTDQTGLTGNKIFRHLSIALFKNSVVLAKAFGQTLKNIFPPNHESEIKDLCNIFKHSIINPFHIVSDIDIDLNSKSLRGLLGSPVSLKLTEKQREILQTLNNIYASEEDKINKLAYHLRPANLSMKINSIMASTQGVMTPS
jgi:radical SAM superfamily enzyme YgiQ (UPF0313 family)